ncbi:MAG: hypothetical protein A4E60_02874 [Syntrophorhabdus sp. PtaB.Bin047]|nr:MAG: hypothetical protein A4E60_02874 [Syntrophorhabdus sp. PtaB.Bin047]
MPKAMVIRLIIITTASPKPTVKRSKPRLNQSKKRLKYLKMPFCEGVECLRRRAHMAGVRVSAMNPESATDMTMVMANCL